jgi:hypothetical protein
MRRLQVGVVVALVTFGLAAGGASAATPKWRMQHSSMLVGDPNASLIGVSCASTTACTAVGMGSSRAFAETWDGSRWTRMRTPRGIAQFDAVSCAASTQCMAVGQTSAGAPAVMSWDGSTWRREHVTFAAHFQDVRFAAVSCASTTDCVVVGSAEDHTRFAVVPVAQRWNGSSWSNLHARVPKRTIHSEFYGVSCPAPTTCVAVGFREGGTDPQPLVEKWDAGAWSIARPTVPADAVDIVLASVSCPSTSVCTAVGSYEEHTFGGTLATLAERGDGSTWTIQPTPPPTLQAGVFFSSVSCGSTSSCVAVGPFDESADAFAERWDGSTWAVEHVPVGASSIPNLETVSCASDSVCTAVGSATGRDGHEVPLIERDS